MHLRVQKDAPTNLCNPRLQQTLSVHTTNTHEGVGVAAREPNKATRAHIHGKGYKGCPAIYNIPRTQKTLSGYTQQTVAAYTPTRTIHPHQGAVVLSTHTHQGVVVAARELQREKGLPRGPRQRRGLIRGVGEDAEDPLQEPLLDGCVDSDDVGRGWPGASQTVGCGGVGEGAEDPLQEPLLRCLVG